MIKHKDDIIAICNFITKLQELRKNRNKFIIKDDITNAVRMNTEIKVLHDSVESFKHCKDIIKEVSEEVNK